MVAACEARTVTLPAVSTVSALPASEALPDTTENVSPASAATVPASTSPRRGPPATTTVTS